MFHTNAYGTKAIPATATTAIATSAVIGGGQQDGISKMRELWVKGLCVKYIEGKETRNQRYKFMGVAT
jgi:hypothetical protein